MFSRLSKLFSHSPDEFSSPAFGLVGWLESTRLILPLRGVDARFTVVGDVAEIQLDQVFVQNQAVPLDVTYTFPLPDRATVFRCEMVVNGRVVAGQVRRREEAIREFIAAKRDGRRALLIEQERGNLFTLQLGNLPPGEVIIVRLGYVQELERLSRTVGLRIPFTPGVRYIPGAPLLRSNRGNGVVDDTDEVPDASRLVPPRIDALHPDAAQVCIVGRFDGADLTAGSFVSPTHGLAVRRKSESWMVGLAEGTVVPEKDFVLRWEIPPSAGDNTSPLLVCAESGPTAAESFYFVQLTAPQVKMERGPVEMWVLLDHSGSMDTPKWQKCCRAMTELVSRLLPTDKFALTLFNSGFRDFSAGLESVESVRRDPRFRRLERLRPDGGTELRPALEHVIARWTNSREKVSRHLVLLTDGQVGNENQLLQLARQLRDTRIHCFGIDFAVNDTLLERLAAESGGRCVLLTPSEDIADAVGALATQLNHPYLVGLQSPPDCVTGGDGATQVFAGDVCSWICRGPARQNFAVQARLTDGTPVRLEAPVRQNSSRALELLWTKRTAELWLRTGRWDEALALAIAANILVEGLAYVAVDFESRVPVATQTFYQPSVAEAEHFTRGLCNFSRTSALCAPVDDASQGFIGSGPAPTQERYIPRAGLPLAPHRIVHTLWMQLCPRLTNLLGVEQVGLVLFPGHNSFIRAILDWAGKIGGQFEKDALELIRIELVALRLPEEQGKKFWDLLRTTREEVAGSLGIASGWPGP